MRNALGDDAEDVAFLHDEKLLPSARHFRADHLRRDLSPSLTVHAIRSPSSLLRLPQTAITMPSAGFSWQCRG